MRFAPALDMADHTLTYRLIVKERKEGRLLRDVHAEADLRRERVGHGHAPVVLHDGRNAFFDGDDEWHLSEVGKAFIAGQLRHAREIAAVFAQWVNPLVQAARWATRRPCTWRGLAGTARRRIRIPLYKPGHEQATRAEIRCPDPACNPYLTFAAPLHAGLEGIERATSRPSRWRRTSTT